ARRIIYLPQRICSACGNSPIQALIRRASHRSSPCNSSAPTPSRAGSSGLTHWMVGNDGTKQFDMRWLITSDEGWEDFPSGTVHLMPRSSQPLDVSIPVPWAYDGIHGIHLTVTTPEGGPASAAGSFLLYGHPLPPPVVFDGPDTLFVGNVGRQGHAIWGFNNLSDHVYTAYWKVTGFSDDWLVSPRQGSLDLPPFANGYSGDGVNVLITFPDTAAVGSRSVTMTLSQPDGKPDFSLTSTIYVVVHP